MKHLILILFFIFSSINADIILISSKDCKTNEYKKSEIKNLFFGISKKISGDRIIPLDRKENEIYEIFLKKFFNKNVSQMNSYWIRMLFTGKRKPPLSLSNEELKNYPILNNCYISYIIDNEIFNNWKRVVLRD